MVAVWIPSTRSSASLFPKGRRSAAVSIARVASRRLTSRPRRPGRAGSATRSRRSEEHTSELQSLMRNSYAVFCLQKKKDKTHTTQDNRRTLNAYSSNEKSEHYTAADNNNNIVKTMP